ncbi:MAG: helix-turn-helix transcriptional regulator [Clostridia bacterium]|nr:helix-turn-helix transcriptional regulator [Clostridia bacterium]
MRVFYNPKESSRIRNFSEDHLVTAIKALVDDKIYEALRVSEICTALGYSKSYLCKLFHEQTGNTIASYAIGVKIDRAKQMIHEGRYNFAQISDKLAFDNPQYFSRVFKRVTDMTPTEFKRSLHR